MKMDKAAVIRVILFALAWINQLLVSNGYQSLPILGEEEVSALIVFVVSVWTLVTNNRIKKRKEKVEPNTFTS